MERDRRKEKIDRRKERDGRIEIQEEGKRWTIRERQFGGGQMEEWKDRRIDMMDRTDYLSAWGFFIYL